MKLPILSHLVRVTRTTFVRCIILLYFFSVFFNNFILCIAKIICVFCAIVFIIDARFAAAIGLSD